MHHRKCSSRIDTSENDIKLHAHCPYRRISAHGLTVFISYDILTQSNKSFNPITKEKIVARAMDSSQCVGLITVLRIEIGRREESE